MYFRVLALEEKDLLVLNYSPGPVHTDMFNEVIQNTHSEDIKSKFQNFQASNYVLQPIDTARKFITIVGRGEYTSGDHVESRKYD